MGVCCEREREEWTFEPIDYGNGIDKTTSGPV